MVRAEDLIPRSLPPADIGVSRHLFERIHHKDPLVILGYLEELGLEQAVQPARGDLEGFRPAPWGCAPHAAFAAMVFRMETCD